MPSRVTVVPLFHDLLSTPTNQPASLYDEFGYCFEHARLRSRLSLLGVGRSITTGPGGSHYLRQAARASPPFEPDVIEITDAGGVSIIAVAEHRDIDQVCPRGVFPGRRVDGMHPEDATRFLGEAWHNAECGYHQRGGRERA